MPSSLVATVVRRHLRLHVAQRILEAYSAGESFDTLLASLTPDQRQSAEGLLRAAAEAWTLAAAALPAPPENADESWLR